MEIKHSRSLNKPKIDIHQYYFERIVGRSSSHIIFKFKMLQYLPIETWRNVYPKKKKEELRCKRLGKPGCQESGETAGTKIRVIQQT